MRPSPFILSAMLAAALLAGCTEEIVTVPDQSSYRQDTTDTRSDVTTGSQGLYTDPFQVVTTEGATPSSGALAESGVQAEVTASQPRGLFKKTLELSVHVKNPDAVAHTGYLVATFKDAAGKTDLQYLYLALPPGADQTVKLTSSIPATSGSVAFKERFL